MSGYSDLIQMAFTNKPAKKPADPAGIVQPAGFVPAVAPVQRDESRDQINPDVMANVQAYVWNNGAPPPPKAPNQANTQRGTSASMTKESGWGRT